MMLEINKKTTRESFEAQVRANLQKAQDDQKQIIEFGDKKCAEIPVPDRYFIAAEMLGLWYNDE